MIGADQLPALRHSMDTTHDDTRREDTPHGTRAARPPKTTTRACAPHRGARARYPHHRHRPNAHTRAPSINRMYASRVRFGTHRSERVAGMAHGPPRAVSRWPSATRPSRSWRASLAADPLRALAGTQKPVGGSAHHARARGTCGARRATRCRCGASERGREGWCEHAPLPWANRHVRDLCPHSLQMEQRCGRFFRESPTLLPPPPLDRGGLRSPRGLPSLLLLGDASFSTGI
jgi:hypothetical protein